MPRRIGIEVFVDPTQAERGFAKTASAATLFTKEIERAGRGAAAGSGLFQGLGRSLAFASGGFLVFSSATALLSDSVKAARDAGVAQRELAAQMKASGQSFQANREQIQQTSLAYGKFGFTNEDVIQSLTVLERGTGNINRALQLQGLAADLARAKNISLADAATTLAKVFGGQETALRRAVPGLEKHAHGLDLIAEAQKRLAGQAQAGTTVAEQFSAALHNTEVIIGTALLPLLNKYLGQLSVWLNKTQNQKKIQQDANAVVKAGAGAFNVLSTAIGWATVAAEKFAYVYNGGLRKGNGLIPGGGPVIQHGATVYGLAGAPGFGFDPFRAGTGGTGTPIQPSRRPTTLAGQFNLAQLRLAQAGITTGTGDDRAALESEKSILELEIKRTTTLKDRTALTQQLAGIVGQINSLNTQGLSTAQKQTSEIAKQNSLLQTRADKIKSAVLSQLQNRQTSVLNQRALADAQAQLHTARLLGGPQGIRLALQAVSDARFAIFQAQLSAAPATLSAKGRFAIGNVITIHVNGTTNPDEVARKVVEILQRRSRHTSTQSRGPSPGAAVGAH